MRKFEKITFEQYKRDILDDIHTYNEFKLPYRSTKYSAGYDFKILYDLDIKPNEIVKIPTGVKVCMNDSEVLLIVDRSSLGFKYNIRICNQVGIIDKDYYNNINNEGHIYIKLQNEGKETLHLKKYDSFAQGIFVNYLTTDNEEQINSIRNGGIGSTNKEEKK